MVTRMYDRERSVVFWKTREAFGGLSNMAGHYPLMVHGVGIPTSEALYQACRFPHLPDIQREIVACTSPIAAKMLSHRCGSSSRPDWITVRLAIMAWCLRVKLAQNWERFGALLLSTEDKPIVEESLKDPFWGAVPIDATRLSGVNALGRLLMDLRQHFREDPDGMRSVAAPARVRDHLLFGQKVGVIVGHGD